MHHDATRGPDGERERQATTRASSPTSATSSLGAIETRPIETWTPGTVVALQRSIGNRRTSQLISAHSPTGPVVRRRPQVQRQPKGGTKPEGSAPPVRGEPAPAAQPEVPAVGELAQTSMTWIDQVWNSLNQGLADFDHNSKVDDWEAFAIGVLGNLIWAAAAFSTGGAAFLISIGGIGLASKAAASVGSKQDFFNAARRSMTRSTPR